MKEVRIDVTCSLDDYITFNLYVLNKYYKSNLMIIIMRVFGLLSVLCGLLIDEFLIFIYLGMVLLLFSIVYYPILKRSVKKIYNESPLMGQKSILTMNQSNLTEVSETNTSNYSWENIVQIGESDKYIYIYISKAQAYVVNKDKVSRDEVTNLKSLFPNNIKKI